MTLRIRIHGWGWFVVGRKGWGGRTRTLVQLGGSLVPTRVVQTEPFGEGMASSPPSHFWQAGHDRPITPVLRFATNALCSRPASHKGCPEGTPGPLTAALGFFDRVLFSNPLTCRAARGASIRQSRRVYSTRCSSAHLQCRVEGVLYNLSSGHSNVVDRSGKG